MKDALLIKISPIYAFGIWTIIILTNITISKQHPQPIEWDYLVPTTIVSIMAPLAALSQYKP